jgi:hypothetical protein
MQLASDTRSIQPTRHIVYIIEEFTAHVSLYDRDKEVGFLHSLGMANDTGDSIETSRDSF